MKERIIRLNEVNDVEEFIRAAEQCEFHISLIYQHASIDGKSILGVFCFLSKDMKVSYLGENQVFEQILQKYAVA